jgi:hypothetical protein
MDKLPGNGIEPEYEDQQGSYIQPEFSHILCRLVGKNILNKVCSHFECFKMLLG